MIDGKPVTCIGAFAFSTSVGLTSLTIPDSVTVIGTNAFYGCTGLKSVTMSKAVVRLLIKNTFPPDIEVIYDIDGWWKGSE